jgi:rod shape-determining protein MreC
VYKKKSKIIGIGITILVLILLVFFSNVKSGSLSYIENAFSKIVMPLQNGYTYLKNKISGNTNFFTNMDALKAENEKLQEENKKLAQNLRELEIIKAENETLKEYVGLTEKYSNYQTIPAYIISKDISNYSKTFIINIGKKDGIEANMTVISDQGLVRICNFSK